jgi:hypothetical protein
VIAPSTLVPLTYRIRAVTPNRASPWFEYGPFVSEPTLGLAVTGGVIRPRSFTVAGTFVSHSEYEPDPWFDPARQGLKLLVGDLRCPITASIYPRDPGWSVEGGAARWTGTVSVSYSESIAITIALGRLNGTFRIHGEGALPFGPSSTGPWTIAVNLAFSEYYGGTAHEHAGGTVRELHRVDRPSRLILAR